MKGIERLKWMLQVMEEEYSMAKVNYLHDTDCCNTAIANKLHTHIWHLRKAIEELEE